jgi:hypothetical protein
VKKVVIGIVSFAMMISVLNTLQDSYWKGPLVMMSWFYSPDAMNHLTRIAAQLAGGPKEGKAIAAAVGLTPSRIWQILQGMEAQGLVFHGYVLTDAGRTQLEGK